MTITAWVAAVLTIAFAAQRPEPPRGARLNDPPLDDGKRDVTISGCLLRNGYAGYQVEDAQIDAIDGKAVSKEAAASAPPAPKKWILDGGGNLGADTGKKIQVVGRSDWRPASAASDEPPNRTPHLEVKTVKVVADACT